MTRDEKLGSILKVIDRNRRAAAELFFMNIRHKRLPRKLKKAYQTMKRKSDEAVDEFVRVAEKDGQ